MKTKELKVFRLKVYVVMILVVGLMCLPVIHAGENGANKVNDASVSTVATAVPDSTLNSGDTAWVLMCAALVFIMTAPGLALFYGGLVRKKNVL